MIRDGDPFTGLGELPDTSEDPQGPAPHRPRPPKTSPTDPESGEGVHQYDAFARSWLRFQFALDTLLGVKPDGRKVAYRGFKKAATKD